MLRFFIHLLCVRNILTQICEKGLVFEGFDVDQKQRLEKIGNDYLFKYIDGDILSITCKKCSNIYAGYVQLSHGRELRGALHQFLPQTEQSQTDPNNEIHVILNLTQEIQDTNLKCLLLVGAEQKESITLTLIGPPVWIAGFTESRLRNHHRFHKDHIHSYIYSYEFLENESLTLTCHLKERINGNKIWNLGGLNKSAIISNNTNDLFLKLRKEHNGNTCQCIVRVATHSDYKIEVTLKYSEGSVESATETCQVWKNLDDSETSCFQNFVIKGLGTLHWKKKNNICVAPYTYTGTEVLNLTCSKGTKAKNNWLSFSFKGSNNDDSKKYEITGTNDKACEINYHLPKKKITEHDDKQNIECIFRKQRHEEGKILRVQLIHNQPSKTTKKWRNRNIRAINNKFTVSNKQTLDVIKSEYFRIKNKVFDTVGGLNISIRKKKVNKITMWKCTIEKAIIIEGVVADIAINSPRIIDEAWCKFSKKVWKEEGANLKKNTNYVLKENQHKYKKQVIPTKEMNGKWECQFNFVLERGLGATSYDIPSSYTNIKPLSFVGQDLFVSPSCSQIIAVKKPTSPVINSSTTTTQKPTTLKHTTPKLTSEISTTQKRATKSSTSKSSTITAITLAPKGVTATTSTTPKNFTAPTSTESYKTSTTPKNFTAPTFTEAHINPIADDSTTVDPPKFEPPSKNDPNNVENEEIKKSDSDFKFHQHWILIAVVMVVIVILFILICLYVLKLRKRPQLARPELDNNVSYENLRDQNSRQFPLHIENTYAKTSDNFNEEETYSVPYISNVDKLYAKPLPKNQRLKPDIKTELYTQVLSKSARGKKVIYAEVVPVTNNKQRAKQEEVLYSEIKHGYSNDGQNYENDFNKQYVNSKNDEYAEPAYCEINKR